MLAYHSGIGDGDGGGVFVEYQRGDVCLGLVLDPV